MITNGIIAFCIMVSAILLLILFSILAIQYHRVKYPSKEKDSDIIPKKIEDLLTDIQVLNLMPGETLVLTLSESQNPVFIKDIVHSMKRIFPKNNIVILKGKTTLKVVREAGDTNGIH